jgi:RNase P subunit RPR2
MNNSDKNFLVNYSKKVGLKIDSNLTINDVYNSAYILSSENNKQVKDNLVRIIWDEKYSKIANLQKGELLPAQYEKKCNHCKQTKNQMEFDHRFDKKNNINYLNFICKDCRVEYNRNYYNKKKQQKHELVCHVLVNQ